MKISGKKVGKLAFEIDHNGHSYILDTSEEIGGENRGPSPKGLLLSGLIGCTGIDVAMILAKMRVEYEDLQISAETELTDGQPSVFQEIILSYHVTGKQGDANKIRRAVELSMQSYCGVSAMLEKHSKIITRIFLNGEEL
jgi:putative redox protein